MSRNQSFCKIHVNIKWYILNEDRYYVVDYAIKHDIAIFTILFKNKGLLMPESIQLDRVRQECAKCDQKIIT